jgi:protein gp37
MNKTRISYLTHTWNPIVGCTHGCPWCWARRQARRQKHNCQQCYDFIPHLHPERLDEPLRKRKPLVIGVAFMGDLFDPALSEPDRVWVFDVIQKVRQHTFVLLTKRPDEAKRWLNPPENLVLGVSVEDQASADRLIPELLQCPAATRIVSIEPMRGPVDLSEFPPFCDPKATPEEIRAMRAVWPDGLPANSMNAIWVSMKIDGVILGGQTGPGAVPMHPDWVRAVRDQCKAAGVPFYFKQWGEYRLDVSPYVPPHMAHEGKNCFLCVGREAAGRVLDGRTHDALAWMKPEAER